MTFPFVLPDLVNKTRASIMSLVHGAEFQPGTTKVQFRLVVKDNIRQRRYISELFQSLDEIPRVVNLTWVPSKTVRAWILVIIWKGLYRVVSAAKLDWALSLTGQFQIKDQRTHLQIKVRKSLDRMRRRLKTYRRSTFVEKSKSNLRNPNENYTVQIPYVRYNGFGLAESGQTAVTLLHRDWTGVRTPGFKAKAEAGTLPVNPHHVYWFHAIDYGWTEAWDPKPGVSGLEFVLWQGAYTRYGLVGTLLNPGCNHLAAVKERAIDKLGDQIRNGVSNLAESVFQMSLVSHMMVNTVKKILVSVRNLKKGNFDGAVQALWGTKPAKFREGGYLSHTKTLADNWLELQFGWKPALQDLATVFAVIKGYSLDNRSIQSIYASSSKLETLRVNLGPDVLGKQLVVGTTQVFTNSRCKISIRFQVANTLKMLLSQTGFATPVSTAYELLPWSFVLDYVYPIGHYLESLSTYDGLVFLDGVETKFTRQSVFHDVQYRGDRYPTGGVRNTTQTLDGGFKLEAIRLDRVKLTSFPTLSKPTLKNPFTATHVTNVLALLVHAFKR